jgi:predicted TIM-barrel fold metal-dependent hydrolase
MTTLNRRSFNKLALVTLASVAGGACRKDSDYTAADSAALEAQQRAEALAAGKGPYGRLRFRGYRGLAELPYFELDEDGELRLTVDLPPAVDFHTHLGINLLFAPDIDLMRKTSRIQYLLDCDATFPGCDFDLDVYINTAFDEEAHAELRHNVIQQLLLGSDAAATHTIPNLRAEMQRVGFASAVVLPIATGLPFGDDLTERWLATLTGADSRDSFIPFASVHPRFGDWQSDLRRYADSGARGIKVHPEMQLLFPDEPRMMEIYAECQRLGLAVLYHAGRSGIEPEFMRKYALLRRYAPAIESFPKVQFILGHAGARDVDDAVALARQHDNVWLELTGQGVTKLDEIIRTAPTERLLFGSDWPFYPLAATLAKLLLVTEKRQELRAAILRYNADRVLELAAATRA